jgi:pyruvate/2-oxoglutarate dehydrogenase complex dihydrolipoamide acyltransferase (E2) component
MTAAIVLPDLGAGDDAIRVGCWLVEPGESVCEGDRLIELLLPGMTFDVAAPVSGVLARIECPFDATVRPGTVLGWIETEPAGDLG